MSKDPAGSGTAPLPRYSQIAAEIRRQIEQNPLSPHSKLASEVQLARQYAVSRGTITTALDTLVQQGVLYRRRPQGTFVAGPAARGGPPAVSPPAVVGLVVPFPPDRFVGGIILGVETVTRAAGYALIFAYSDNDPALERYHMEQFRSNSAAGILLFPTDHLVERRAGRLVSADGGARAAALHTLQERGVPFVLIDRYVPELQCDYVVSDDVAAGHAATQHLAALGHRRIGFISVMPQVTSLIGRYEGYRQCLQEYSLPFDEGLVLPSLRQANPSSMPEGLVLPGAGQQDRELLEAFLYRLDRPSAVIAANDYIGLRLLQIAEDLQLEVPDDLAIVCCGGSDLGAHGRVPLTSILQPAAELGRQAASILLDRIASRSSVVRHLSLPVSLVVRRSCGAPPRTAPLAVSRTGHLPRRSTAVRPGQLTKGRVGDEG